MERVYAEVKAQISPEGKTVSFTRMQVVLARLKEWNTERVFQLVRGMHSTDPMSNLQDQIEAEVRSRFVEGNTANEVSHAIFSINYWNEQGLVQIDDEEVTNE